MPASITPPVSVVIRFSSRLSDGAGSMHDPHCKRGFVGGPKTARS